jgi:hypothetical protein
MFVRSDSRGVIKNHFPFLFLIVLLAVVAFIPACSSSTPEPQPQAQPKAAESEARPAVEEPGTPVEEPHRQVLDAPKAKAEVRDVPKAPAPRKPVSAAKQTAAPAPAPAPTPASTQTASSSTPGTLSLPAPVPPPIEVPAPPRDEVKPVEPPAPREVKIPSGTLVAVRMIDSVDSETAHQGETFKASLEEPIVLDNETVFPKNSEVYVKLTKVQSAGRVSGKSELQLQLDRIFLGKTGYVLESSTYVNTGAGQGGKTARSAGIGAAIGAAIGAIAGGGKGAVIGATTGAGAGAGVEAIRKGEQVRVESETRLDFRLEAPLEVTLQSPSSNTSRRNNPSGPVRLGTRQ